MSVFSKAAALLVLTLVSTSVLAQGSPAGSFEEKSQTAVFGYSSQDDCAADSGSWKEDVGLCLFEVVNSVQVVPTKAADTFDIVIDTVGSNAHSCRFEEKAKRLGPNKLVSSVEADDYRSELPNAKTTCEVTLTYKTANEVSVETNGKCSSFCGMRATLDIESATR